MYPSTNYVDGNISFTSINVQPMTLSSFYNDVDLSKPFPHYITLEDETICNDLLQQENYLFSHDHNHHHHDTNDIVGHENDGKLVVRDGDGERDINDGSIDIQLDPKDRNSNNKRRRTSKKDRHSKIDTARGPRDRRMRLSVDVAKKFFKLQDLLGFDKASNTIEWLLMKSKSGIQELLPQKLRSNFMDDVSNNASSSTSKVNNQCMVNEEDDEETLKHQKSSSSSNNFKEKKKSTSGTRGVGKSEHHLHSPLAKETRERARARARERTMEKSSKLGLGGGDDQCSSKSRPCLDRVFDQCLHLLGPSSTIHDQPEPQISQSQFKQGISGDNSSLMTANLSPSFLFNYQHAGFGAFPHEHQFNDFQILGNLWEDNE